MGLAIFPYRKILQFFDWSSRSRAAPQVASADDPTVHGIVLLVRAAGRRILGKRPCLPQALVVRWLLRRRGYSASLQMGVTKDESDKLLAHAWVESGGEILIGGRLSPTRYNSLRSLEKRLSQLNAVSPFKS